MTNQDPSQPPACCPACGAAITHTWKSPSGESDFIQFECNLELANQSGNPGWRVRFQSRCKNFYSDPLVFSAVVLRRELDASNQADAIILPTLERAKEILCAGNYDNVDHAAQKVVDERDSLRQQVAALTAERDALQVKLVQYQARAKEVSWKLAERNGFENTYIDDIQAINAISDQLTEARAQLAAVTEAVTEWANNVDNYNQRLNGFCLVGDDDLDLLRAALTPSAAEGETK